MLKIGNLFELAIKQLQRERKSFKFSLMLDRAIRIRHYLDLQARNKKVRKNQLKKLALAK